MTWWHDIVAIESANRIEDPGFESRQSACKVFSSLQCCCQDLICIVIVFM
jgi:hypothetical protein